MDYRGDGAPPEGAAEARSAPPTPAESPPQIQQTDAAHPATNSPPSILPPHAPWAPTTARVTTALPEHTPPAVAENDPPPWMWLERQHAANPATQAIDPAWAAYWANQAQPPAANGAPVAHNGQYPLYSPVIAPATGGAINRNKELLAFLIGVAASVGVAILALAGYLVFGRGGSSIVIPTVAIAVQPVVQATSVPTRAVAPTVVRPATTARAPSAVAPVGTATAIATVAIATTAIAAPTLAVHAQAPLSIPVILPPTIAAGAVATPTAPARALPVVLTPSVNAGVSSAATAPAPAIPAVLPPPAAVPAETRPSVPPTLEPSTATSPSSAPLSPFVPRPAVPKPAPAVSSSPPSATPLSPFVPRPAAPQPVPTTPTLPTSPPPTPTISPPASTPAALKTQTPGVVRP